MTNWTGNKYERNLLNDYYLSTVENVELTLRIPGNRKVRKVSLLIDAAFTKNQDGEKLEIRLPRVETYQALSIEME